jgi:hypothetical protein
MGSGFVCYVCMALQDLSRVRTSCFGSPNGAMRRLVSSLTFDAGSLAVARCVSLRWRISYWGLIGPPVTTHSRPSASHHLRYTLATLGRRPPTGTFRKPCRFAASKRIRSFSVNRWPTDRLPMRALVGKPRLSRSTSSFCTLATLQRYRALSG